LPNIVQHGWIDVAVEDFARLTEESVALVYPSCREGQAGAVVNCMRAGLIPLVSRESGVDVNAFGACFEDSSVASVRDSVRWVASMAASDLRARSRATWDFAASRFTPRAYLTRYGEIVNSITGAAKVAAA
jgi:hypothetical protein